MSRMYAPSPTVRSSRVPLYMQGISRRLGQDLPDDFFAGAYASPTLPDYVAGPDFSLDVSPGFSWDTSIMSPPTALTPLLDAGFTQRDASLISQAAASGVLSNADWNNIVSGRISVSDVLRQLGLRGGSPQPAWASIASTGAGAFASAARAANTAAPGGQPISPGPRVSAWPSGITDQLKAFFGQPTVAGLSLGALAVLALGGALVLSRK